MRKLKRSLLKRVSLIPCGICLALSIIAQFWLFPVISSTQPLQSFPSARDLTPQISASVEVGSNSSNLRYRYTISNAPTSRQALDLWAVSYVPPVTVKIVGTPTGWIENEAIGHNPLAGWTGLTPLSPGSSQPGFELEAESLPAIAQAIVIGFIPIEQLPTFPEGQAPENLPGSSILDNNVKVNTIGPVPLPTIINPSVFLNTIISFKERAFALGWIDNSGIKNSLDAKLNAAKASITRGQIQAAKKQLIALLNEVEAQAGKHLTLEAYGLLRFNVQFLLDHL